MSDLLPSFPRLFLKCGLLHTTQAGPGPWNPKVNLLCGKFSRAVACVWLFAEYKFYRWLIDETIP